MPANTQKLEILNGWKEIANYLGKGVRSVQRYEFELGLPIRRPAGKSRGAVIATKAELDGWITASPIRETFRLSHTTADHAPALQEFHGHMEELHRLREQAAQLRGELRLSLETLRASIQMLSVQRLPPSSPERRLLADVLCPDPTRKKAN